MPWQEQIVQLTSTAPLLMHNGQLCDPMNKWARSMKLISGKQKKTDADHVELSRLEFLGGLYVNGNGPCLPAEMVMSTLINAAKKRKEGPRAKSGMYVDQSADLAYKGPRDPGELWETGCWREHGSRGFVDKRPAKVGMARIMRTRPIFLEWSAQIVINYDDTIANCETVYEWCGIAGSQIGCGDNRPINGRFTVEAVNGKGTAAASNGKKTAKA